MHRQCLSERDFAGGSAPSYNLGFIMSLAFGERPSAGSDSCMRSVAGWRRIKSAPIGPFLVAVLIGSLAVGV
jgi:hypothetical protein